MGRPLDEFEDEKAFAQKVFRVLKSNPTASELDFLVEAHARIGYSAAVAQGLAEEAEAKRKYEEAVKYGEIKLAEPKYTAAQTEAAVTVACYTYRTAEVEAEVAARKLNNLLDSIREAINGIKYLGRNGGGDVRIGP